MDTPNLSLEKSGAPLPAKATPSPIDILEAAVRGGISAENVAVVKELTQMCREQRAEDAKLAFNKAFFALRKEMPVIYADKTVTTKSGAVAFEYCSPQEIKDTLEPLMQRHGFCTMTGQVMNEGGTITATVTLMHEAGHSEQRSYTTRASGGNALMTPTQCDAAATTNAERHALIKMFGLRTRLRADDDAKNLGEYISKEQAEELQHRVKMTNSNELAFLKLAGVTVEGEPKLEHYGQIMSGKYALLDEKLSIKERAGK